MSIADEIAGIPEDNDEEIRSARERGCKISLLQLQLRDEKAKLKQAEADLVQARELVEIVEATKDQIKSRGKKRNVTKSKASGTATAIIGATDWHLEEAVDPDTINGLNETSLDIMDTRINALWDKSLFMLDFARNISNIKSIVLWLGGDLINGYIHEEMEESNFAGPTEAILLAQDYVVDGIDRILKEAKPTDLTVVCNFGNHGRTTQKRRVSTGYRTSWEWLAFNNVARYYRKDPKVNFQIAKGYHAYLDIQGHVVRFHHGDQMRYLGGSGGLSLPVNKAVDSWNKSKRADMDIFGHYHTWQADWSWVSAGCAVGYNAYALSIKARYQPPTQPFIVVDREYGRVMAEPIFVAPPVKMP
jgi:hypothetical protein